MAKNDIMPWRSALGGHFKIERHRLTAAQTFEEGECVLLAAAGTITIAADAGDAATPTSLYGLAAEPAEGMATDAAGTTNPTNALRGIHPFDDISTEFITDNYSDAGAAFGDAAPDMANIGDTCGIALIGGIWGVELVSDNENFLIIDVLDSDKSTPTTGTDGTWVVFRRIMA